MYKKIHLFFFLFLLTECLTQEKVEKRNLKKRIAGLYPLWGLDLGLYPLSRVVEGFMKDLASHDVEKNTECLASLKDVIKGYNESEIWALKMFDASTKLPSGIFEGNTFDLGHFDECIRIDRRVFKEAPYIGQYCPIQLKIVSGVTNQTVEIGSLKVPLRDILGNGFLPIFMAQCLPSTCRPDLIEKGYNDILKNSDTLLPFPDIKFQADIDERDCYFEGKRKLDNMDWFVAYLCVIIFGVITTSTILHILGKPQIGQELWESLSLKTNAVKLFEINTCPGELFCINGLKSISNIAVSLVTIYGLFFNRPTINLLTYAEGSMAPSYKMLTNNSIIVDTFFVLSGILTAHSFFEYVKRKKSYTLKDYFQSAVHRYVRLSGPYLVMILLQVTWLYKVGNGPQWEREVGNMRNICQQNWLSNLLYLNNYQEVDKMCLPQTWFLSLIMQYFLLTPLILYPLLRWKTLGLIQMFILVSLSVANTTSISYDTQSQIRNPFSEKRMKIETGIIYLSFITHATPYIIGLATGYILDIFKSKKKMIFKNSTLIFGWSVCIFCLCYPFLVHFVVVPHLNELKYESVDKITISLSTGSFRYMWSLAISWIVFVCATRNGGLINSILTWEPFSTMSKLSYGHFLINTSLIINGLGSKRIATFVTVYNCIMYGLGLSVLSFMLSIILHLFVEQPVKNIDKFIQERRNHSPHMRGKTD